MLTEEILEIANNIKEELVDVRRYMHKYPELSFEEFKTSEFIKEKLKEHNINYIEDFHKTAVVALIKGRKEGKTILVRGDIDALPIEENNSLEYKSLNKGVMHACGHDAHIAWTLGTAIILNKLKDKIKGNVKFIFQPGEENQWGAKEMLKYGILENPKVDAAIAGHVWPDVQSGKIAIVNGCAMACANKFRIEIIGKGGHGASPQDTLDPIAIANEVYMTIQQIVSRKVDPYDSVVISIGVFKAQGSYNIIPDKVEMEGTIRTLSKDKMKEIIRLIDNILKGIVLIQEAKYRFDATEGVYPLINSEEFVYLAREAVVKVLGESNVEILKHGSMTGDDFSYFLNKVPGVFMYVGTLNNEKNINKPLHNCNFDIDEDIIYKASTVLSQLVIDYLNS
ncbi:M20 metallopeptidase family protein [Clostridium sporogenes]|uniref:M20 metallopeptidase family protein n=1 Tax=Clostridium sporogenes TaxID=1509 RepID=UPI0005ED6E5F|nr:M20 family metallopeptidase [Clostridium sporogenes]MBW5455915.1 amidohydrolase [Clostridium sporogenes]